VSFSKGHCWCNDYCRFAGEYTAKWIDVLVEEANVSADHIHIIGASLGGQAAGHAGFHSRCRVGRITALDPTGPLFHAEPSQNKLDPR